MDRLYVCQYVYVHTYIYVYRLYIYGTVYNIYRYISLAIYMIRNFTVIIVNILALFKKKKKKKNIRENYLTLSAPALFSAKYKIFFFLKFIASSVFMLERYIKRPFF